MTGMSFETEYCVHYAICHMARFRHFSVRLVFAFGIMSTSIYTSSYALSSMPVLSSNITTEMQEEPHPVRYPKSWPEGMSEIGQRRAEYL